MTLPKRAKTGRDFVPVSGLFPALEAMPFGSSTTCNILVVFWRFVPPKEESDKTLADTFAGDGDPVPVGHPTPAKARGVCRGEKQGFDPLANKEANVKSDSLTFERDGMPRLSTGHMPGVHGPKSTRQGRI